MHVFDEPCKAKRKKWERLRLIPSPLEPKIETPRARRSEDKAAEPEDTVRQTNVVPVDAELSVAGGPGGDPGVKKDEQEMETVAYVHFRDDWDRGWSST